VLATVTFSRGLFGCPPNAALIEKILRDLTLWDKRHSKIVTLSGGMKRRLMIAKALSHEPRILFLDEPTAGVDVELRRDMWEMVRRLKESGVTILLTTHYIEEAEQMADRIGVINKGSIVVVDEKEALMQKLGKSQLCVELKQPLSTLPAELSSSGVTLSGDGRTLSYVYDVASEDNGITRLLRQIDALGLDVKNLETRQSSLEEIFVQLLEAA
jgi:ABC-2 type transport system ATP-binding protein